MTSLSQSNNDENHEENETNIDNSPQSLEITADILSSLNKPTAIVKPCQNTGLQEVKIECENIKIYDSIKCSTKILKNKDLKEEPKVEESNCTESYSIQTDTHTKESKLEDGGNKDFGPKTEEDFVEIACKLKCIEKEIMAFSKEKEHVENNNRQMIKIVEEFEKTIKELVVEKEREDVCQQIVMERIILERDEVVSDHQNVERAFADVNHKYERVREVVEGLQLSEDDLSHSVDTLSRRYTAGENKYQHYKTEAQAQLAGATAELFSTQRSKAMEVARLTAQLRKAEIKVSSLEEDIDQKVQTRNILS